MATQTGKAHRFGDNINTDLITPGKYMELPLSEMARHVMEGVSPGFSSQVSPGDMIVAGHNFGSGSSRETAPLALREAGVSAVIALSFARIFYRNAFNIGLPALELPEAERINGGDRLELDLAGGAVTNLTRGETYRFAPLPEAMLDMLAAGGLLQQLKNEAAHP